MDESEKKPLLKMFGLPINYISMRDVCCIVLRKP